MPEDPYSLPPDDPCHSTVEAFKQIAGSVADAYWQALAYQRFRGRLEAWQQCCPELREKAAALRPEITDPAVLQSFVFPSGDAIFAAGGPCAHRIPLKGIADTGGDAPSQVWLKNRNSERAGYWEQAYAQLSTDLRSCCREQLRTCVTGVQQYSPLNPPSMAATDRCIVRFIPKDPGLALAETPPVLGPGDAPPLPADSFQAGDWGIAQRVASSWFEGVAPLRAKGCQDQLGYLLRRQQPAAPGSSTAVGQSAPLPATEKAPAGGEHVDWSQRAGEQREELVRLQGELQAATAVRPGREVLSAISEGRMSGELALLGAIALLAGAVCGLPGIPSLRGKLLSGAAGALIALLVFAGLVAVLPDSRLPYLLLAFAGAVLAALCWALSRALLLLRTRRPAPGQP